MTFIQLGIFTGIFSKDRDFLFIVKGVVILLFLFPMSVVAFNYCDVPFYYPTYGLDYDAVVELVPDSPTNAIWECGLINNLREFETGNTEESHYANAFILLDKKDFSFVSLKKVDGYTIFGGTDSDDQTYYIAMESDSRRLKQLIEVATIVAITGFKDFVFEDGSRHYLPIVKKVAYIH